MFSNPKTDNVLTARVEIYSLGDELISNFALDMPNEDELDIQLLESLSQALTHARNKIDRMVLNLNGL